MTHVSLIRRWMSGWLMSTEAAGLIAYLLGAGALALVVLSAIHRRWVGSIDLTNHERGSAVPPDDDPSLPEGDYPKPLRPRDQPPDPPRHPYGEDH